MGRPLRYLERALRRGIGAADAACNALYHWSGNPIYQSGTLTVAFLVVLLVTGTYLLFFYRIGAPYDSVARLTADPWIGRWVRSLHRFAADAAVVAAAVHALRMFAQDRRWGARTLAWTSGLILFGLILVCGWTGYVMVWDVFGQVLAVEGARLLDVLPIFSEPIGRMFVGERALPGAFFFLNLFLHIALPIGLGIVLWLHVSRVARVTLLPPRRLMWGAIAALTAVSLLWPIGMAPMASAFHFPADVPLDVLYAGWLPASRGVEPAIAWLAGAAIAAVLLLVPLWSRPARSERPAPSVVDPRLCTGCTQCTLDCPWQAIEMVPRTDGRATLVASVDPDRCVSCGICAGSCAPMSIGPPGRTGRDQLARIRDIVTARRPGSRDVVVVACARGAGGITESWDAPGTLLIATECAGNVHSSVIEYLIRAGAGGVLVVACPPRDCWNREGPTWLEARLFQEREAELHARVDRRRVRIVHAGALERRTVDDALAAFRADLARLNPAPAERNIDLDAPCDRESSNRVETA
ncbi:MAG TPA: hydrogenase iron-sulfur subunit [Gemmatimonadaceae bacterium]